MCVSVAVGMSKSEINSVLDEYSEMYMKDTHGSLNEDTFDFLDAMRQRLPPSVTLTDPVTAAGGLSGSSDSSEAAFSDTLDSNSSNDTHIDIEPYLYPPDSSDMYSSSSTSSSSEGVNPSTEFDV